MAQKRAIMYADLKITKIRKENINRYYFNFTFTSFHVSE